MALKNAPLTSFINGLYTGARLVGGDEFVYRLARAQKKLQYRAIGITMEALRRTEEAHLALHKLTETLQGGGGSLLFSPFWKSSDRPNDATAVFPPEGFPRDLLKIPNVDFYILRRLARGHKELVSTLKDILDHPEKLKNVYDARDVGKTLMPLFKKSWRSGGVFEAFYGIIVTPEVIRMLEAGDFEAPDFMERLPAHFMRLYVEAVYTFLTDPKKLKEERPAWYIAFVYCLQPHLWSPIHGTLGIIAHIMADLAIGIRDTIFETYKAKRLSEDPSLEDKPLSFFADELGDPNNQEAADWLKLRRRDHDKIGPMLEKKTPPVLMQFEEEWKDALAFLFRRLEQLTATSPGKNGVFSESLAFQTIHHLRDMAFVTTERLIEAESTLWGFRDIEGHGRIRHSREDVLYTMLLTSQIMAEQISGLKLDEI